MANNHAVPSPRRIKSVHTMFRIVEHLRRSNGGRITDIAGDLDLAKSSVYQHLSTLSDLGYVVKENDEYYVGLGFLQIAEYARHRRQAYRIAEPLVHELADESGERAQFFVEEHGRAIYLHTSYGRHGVRADRMVGTRRYMHSSAGGKAILAYYPDDKVKAIIDRWGLPPETDHTITSRTALFEDLRRVRERGYSLNENESIDGLTAIGVPAKDPSGKVFGSFSISGPSHRLHVESTRGEFVDLLLGKANEYELKVTYS